MNGSKQIERFSVKGLTLEALKEHGKDICRAVIAKASRVLDLDQAGIDYRLSAQRAAQAARCNPSHGLGCLGFQAALYELGEEFLKETMTPRSYRRWKSKTEKLLGPLESPGFTLHSAAVRSAYPFISAAGRDLAEEVQRAMAVLKARVEETTAKSGQKGSGNG